MSNAEEAAAHYARAVREHQRCEDEEKLLADKHARARQATEDASRNAQQLLCRLNAAIRGDKSP